MIMYRIIFASALLAITPASADVLTSSKGLIDRFIDGHSFGIDGKMFGLMLKIRRELIHMLNGDKDNHGRYTFKGKQHSLTKLVSLEQKNQTKQNTETSRALKECLRVVKSDLDTHLTKYAELAKGVKHYMLIFINESCKKHGRASSILQNWAQVKEGHESAQLQLDIVDLQTAYQFCHDLIHFLEDMCESCPKAQEQFKKLLESAHK